MNDWHSGVYHPAIAEGYFHPDLQEAILNRDGNKCLRCGAKRNLTIHHILPRDDGGGDEPENLMTLCKKCHDYIEPLGLRDRSMIINVPDEKEKRVRHKRVAKKDDWHLWVYGAYRNPYIFKD